VTIRAFVETLAALQVTGVKRRYKYPPLQLSTADLPASFVRPPNSDYDPMSICDDTADNMTCRLVIATEPTGQSTQPANYDLMLTMADNLNAAIKANYTDIGALLTWTIAAQDAEPILIGGSAYWGVTATITKRG
jgi:hypothetical protein